MNNGYLFRTTNLPKIISGPPCAYCAYRSLILSISKHLSLHTSVLTGLLVCLQYCNSFSNNVQQCTVYLCNLKEMREEAKEMAFPDVRDNSLLFLMDGQQKTSESSPVGSEKKNQPNKNWKNASKQYTVINNGSEVEGGDCCFFFQNLFLGSIKSVYKLKITLLCKCVYLWYICPLYI